MGAPLKGKTVMGYDPGYRTGCKLAVVDRTGAVVDTAVIYPTKPHERIAESKKIVKGLISKYGVDVIAIGNGTASGESEMFIAETLGEIEYDTKYTMVSEAGASVYSASKLATEEYPDLDVTTRGAMSIGRRLQDPMAELVKIDPKANFAKEGPRGELDIAGIFTALAEAGYTGVCSFEYERDFADNVAAIAECVGYYRGLADALNS